MGTSVRPCWVGHRFGAKVFGRGQAGFIWLLAPTPELWTKAGSYSRSHFSSTSAQLSNV
jgi:hypothetical protein